MVREDNVGGLHISDVFEAADQAAAEKHFEPLVDYWKSHGQKVWLTKDGGPVYKSETKGRWRGWLWPVLAFTALGVMILESLTNPSTLQQLASPSYQPPWWIWFAIPGIILIPAVMVLIIMLVLPSDQCEVCRKNIWHHAVRVTDEAARLYGQDHWLYPVHMFHRKCYGYRMRKEITR